MEPSSWHIYHTENCENELELKKLQPPEVWGIIFTEDFGLNDSLPIYDPFKKSLNNT
jgi:hypothetical protein